MTDPGLHHGSVVNSSFGDRRWTCCGKPEKTVNCAADARPSAARPKSEGGELVWERCEARNCYQRTLVHPKRRPAKVYCGPACAAAGAVDEALYVRGATLNHSRSCPGCAGSGVEDDARWGGGIHLCDWYLSPTERYERGVRCACQGHLMNAKPVLGMPVIELDAVGNKHGFESCSPADTLRRDMTCPIPPHGWYCTRGAGHDGPCAAWPIIKTVSESGRNPVRIGTTLLFLGGGFIAVFYLAWRLFG